MDAILWHGGEAAASRDAVKAMSGVERAQLIAFAAYPFDDPIFHDAGSTPACPADLTGDGTVALDDLLVILSRWGQSGIGDVDGSGQIDAEDIILLLESWGDC